MGKTLNVKKLTNEKWLNLFIADFEHKDKNGEWAFCSRKEMPVPGELQSDAVVIVPFVESAADGLKIGIVKEYRYPIGCHEYSFPAGLKEPDESCVLAAQRELKEEMGLRATKILYVSGVLPSSPGMSDESITMVFVLAEGEVHTNDLESSEDIEAFLYSPEEAKQLLKHAKTTKTPISAKAEGILMLFSALGYRTLDYLQELYE